MSHLQEMDIPGWPVSRASPEPTSATGSPGKNTGRSGRRRTGTVHRAGCKVPSGRRTQGHRRQSRTPQVDHLAATVCSLIQPSLHRKRELSGPAPPAPEQFVLIDAVIGSNIEGLTAYLVHTSAEYAEGLQGAVL